jgi:hypothetical protein
MKLVTLKSNAWRTSAALLLMISSGMVAIGLTATGDQFWPRIGALVGLVALALGIVWFIFVPVELQFDRVELTIRYRFRRSCTIPWCDLEYYGPRRRMFVLQFAGRSLKLFSQAFAPSDWYELMSFLDDRYPECKADGWFGRSGFRWHTK